MVAPSGPVYQAGTLSGNPLAMAAGFATLKILRNDGTYEDLEERSAELAAGISKAAEAAGVPLVVNRVGSMLTPFFTDAPVTDCRLGRKVRHGRPSRRCTGRSSSEGVYWPPSQFEAAFVSTTHAGRDIDETCAAFAHAFEKVSARVSG